MPQSRDKHEGHWRKGMLALDAQTAREMMIPLSGTLQSSASIEDCSTFLIENGLQFAPVIDSDEQLVGVLSRIDVLRFEKSCGRQIVADEERVWFAAGVDLDELVVIDCEPGCTGHTARELMSTDIQRVPLNSPAQGVVNALFENDVNQIFVVDGGGQLVGVIGMTEVLRHLTPG